MKLLAWSEDFRFLPVFVVVSMALGIFVGKAIGVSDYELTPPIDAIKSIFQLVAFSPIIQTLVIPLYAKLLIGEVWFDVLIVGRMSWPLSRAASSPWLSPPPHWSGPHGRREFRMV